MKTKLEVKKDVKLLTTFNAKLNCYGGVLKEDIRNN